MLHLVCIVIWAQAEEGQGRCGAGNGDALQLRVARHAAVDVEGPAVQGQLSVCGPCVKHRMGLRAHRSNCRNSGRFSPREFLVGPLLRPLRSKLRVVSAVSSSKYAGSGPLQSAWASRTHVHDSSLLQRAGGLVSSCITQRSGPHSWATVFWGTGVLRSKAAEAVPEVVEGYKESVQLRLQGMGMGYGFRT